MADVVFLGIGSPSGYPDPSVNRNVIPVDPPDVQNEGIVVTYDNVNELPGLGNPVFTSVELFPSAPAPIPQSTGPQKGLALKLTNNFRSGNDLVNVGDLVVASGIDASNVNLTPNQLRQRLTEPIGQFLRFEPDTFTVILRNEKRPVTAYNNDLGQFTVVPAFPAAATGGDRAFIESDPNAVTRNTPVLEIILE